MNALLVADGGGGSGAEAGDVIRAKPLLPRFTRAAGMGGSYALLVFGLNAAAVGPAGLGRGGMEGIAEEAM